MRDGIEQKESLLEMAAARAVSIQRYELHDDEIYISSGDALSVVQAGNMHKSLTHKYKFPPSVRRVVFWQSGSVKKYLYHLGDCLALDVRGEHYQHTEETRAKMKESQAKRQRSQPDMSATLARARAAKEEKRLARLADASNNLEG